MIPTSVGVDVLVSLADRLTAPLRNAEDTVARASERMQKRLALSMKLAGGGAAAAGIAYGAQRLVTGFTDSIRDVERAKGELATLGVRDLDAVARRGQEMQMQLAGVTADAFVRASYDIKSGISSLTDQGVADMTASAMLVAKATKGQAEQMTSLFATSYGIFKKQMEDLTDAEFGEQFGAALSASVQQFKTDGAAMQQAIESAGAGAVNLGMDMTEQLTLLGMMQQQMQAGEAGTALRAFATNAAKAHEAFGEMQVSAYRPVRVRILDENGGLRDMPDILADLQARYGETLDAFEAAEIKEAFGTDEAMKMVNALYGQEAAVRANADALDDAPQQGSEFTSVMAAAADNNWDATMVLMSQKTDVLRQKIGERLLPAVTKLMPYVDAFVDRAFEWIDANPELITGIGGLVVGIGALAAVAAPVLLAMSALTSTYATAAFAVTRLAVGGWKLFGVLTRLAGIAPLRWARLIPRLAWGGFVKVISWAALAGKLSWRMLLTPLKWGARLIPGIGWAALAGTLAWNLIIKPLGWDKYLPKIDWDRVWGAFSWDGWMPRIDWSQILSAIDWPDWVGDFEWSRLLPSWDWLAIIPKVDLTGLITWPEPPTWWKRLMGEEPVEIAAPRVSQGAGFSALPAEQQDAARVVENVVAAGPLPTPAHIEELELGIADINAQIAEAQAGIANLGQGPMTATMAMPYQDEIRALTADLEVAEAELQSARARSDELGQALQVLGDTEAAPQINTASVDAALAKVARLSASLRSLPGGAAASSAKTGPVQARAKGGKFNPGWLMTGEDGPELEYRTEGGYIAHNRALRGMLDMATRTRDLVGGIGLDGIASAAMPSMSAVAAAGGAAMQRGPVTFSPQYNMPMSLDGGVDLDEVRATVQAELGEAERRAQAALRSLLHD